MTVADNDGMRRRATTVVSGAALPVCVAGARRPRTGGDGTGGGGAVDGARVRRAAVRWLHLRRARRDVRAGRRDRVSPRIRVCVCVFAFLRMRSNHDRYYIVL